MPDGFLPTQPETPPSSAPETAPLAVEEESTVAADEQAFEQLPETRDAFLEQAGEAAAPAAEAAPSAGSAGPSPAVSPAPIQKDEVRLEVERILEDGLGDYFQDLPPDAKVRFQKKGEEVAGQISGMVRGFKVKVKRVLQLIRDWLLTIPGVNKFFLEQEAKIKTDQIQELEHERREGANNSP